MSDKPKFCRDCQHYRPDHYGCYGVLIRNEVCMSPQIEPDLVSGHGDMPPSMARAAADFCGRDAKWFEAKPVPVIPRARPIRHDKVEGRPWWKLWG